MAVSDNRPFVWSSPQVDYKYDIALGNRPNTKVVNKFGFNNDVDNAQEEVIASFGGTWDASNVITTAQTFTISYTNTTDGSGQAGVRLLQIDYIDGEFNDQTAIHVLGSTGSDVTAFEGVGINRVVAIGYGSNNVAGNNITFTATTDGTIQAQIPSGFSVTEQLIFHTPINMTLLLDWISLSVRRLSGGGGDPRVTIRIYSYSRVTTGIYNVLELGVDTAVENNIQLNPSQPLVFTGREVIYITADTDTNNTEVSARFSGIQIPS